jgi:hypothetical protein
MTNMTPLYRSLNDLLLYLEEAQGDACRRLLKDHRERFLRARGSSHNHQAWPGGYLDHVVETLNLAVVQYRALKVCRPLPFALSDAILVLFLHDLEKPWKNLIGFKTKADRREFRERLISDYGIVLTPEQANALRYVEGEGDDYSGQGRVMGPLAAFCHVCDVLSARLWFDHPSVKDDPWIGAQRHHE